MFNMLTCDVVDGDGDLEWGTEGWWDGRVTMGECERNLHEGSESRSERQKNGAQKDVIARER